VRPSLFGCFRWLIEEIDHSRQFVIPTRRRRTPTLATARPIMQNSACPFVSVSRFNSLIPCSNSANSLIFANYFAVTTNWLPCSAPQGIRVHRLGTAGRIDTGNRRVGPKWKNTLLFSLFLVRPMPRRSP